MPSSPPCSFWGWRPRCDCWWAAAFLLAIPVFIKLWPVVLVLLLLVFWPRQLIGRFRRGLRPFRDGPLPHSPAGDRRLAICRVVPGTDRSAARPLAGLPRRVTIWEAGPGSGRGIQDAATGDRPWRVRLVPLAVAPAESRQPVPDVLVLDLGGVAIAFGPGHRAAHLRHHCAGRPAWAVLVSFPEKRARWLTTAALAMTALLASGDFESGLPRRWSPWHRLAAAWAWHCSWSGSCGTNRSGPIGSCARRPSAAVEALPKKRLSPFPRVYDSVNCGLRNASAMRRPALGPRNPPGPDPEPKP